MIYTITLNPAIDYVIKLNEFKYGEVNRIIEENKYAGGKGINVSRVLNSLNVENKALGFIGGFTGEFIKSVLAKDGVDTDFIQVAGDTRINVKLKSNEETEINGMGPNITDDDLNNLYDKVKNLKSSDFLILSGNVQKSLPYDIYSIIQEKCLKNNPKVIVDTTGDALTSTLTYKPFLIKPNNIELGDIFGVEIKDMEDTIKYATKLKEMGAQNIIISMAGEGALLICDEGCYHASVPKGTVRNSVGAGDSLIGGFLANYSQKFNIIDAFNNGVAAGSATAFSMDLCTKDYVEKLYSQVKIKRI